MTARTPVAMTALIIRRSRAGESPTKIARATKVNKSTVAGIVYKYRTGVLSADGRQRERPPGYGMDRFRGARDPEATFARHMGDRRHDAIAMRPVTVPPRYVPMPIEIMGGGASSLAGL